MAISTDLVDGGQFGGDLVGNQSTRQRVGRVTIHRPPQEFAILRRYALTLPGVEEGVHMGGPAFRYRGKKFALWWVAGGRVIMKLDREHQNFLFNLRPEAFERCQVGTGIWSYVDLSKLAHREIRSLTHDAFGTVAPRRVMERIAKPK
jgi:hypothetical protein